MSPRQISELVLHRPPLLRVDESIESAVRRVLDSGLPALPVVDDDARYAGIFGDREFFGALFPGYLKELRSTAFLTRSLDAALETREQARTEPVGRHMNTEHVEVDRDFSDVHVAEVFLRHRVLVVPVVGDGRVAGMITRDDFFRVLAERFAGAP